MAKALIDQLAGHVPEPYQKTKVLKAARDFGYPFTLGEVVAMTGLPAHVCHRILDRLIKDGTLTRTKMTKTFPHYARSSGRWTPGGMLRRVYLYRFAPGK